MPPSAMTVLESPWRSFVESMTFETGGRRVKRGSGSCASAAYDEHVGFVVKLAYTQTLGVKEAFGFEETLTSSGNTSPLLGPARTALLPSIL